MSDLKLKPCPFCGSSDVHLTVDRHKVYDGQIHYVLCFICYAKTGIHINREAAIDRWNSRQGE